MRKQVEYYLSDENLRHDKFFHDKISSDPEGWLELTLLLGCNKMKSMRATSEAVLAALASGSKTEIREDKAAVRRPGKAALPTLEARPQHQKKSSLNAHVGGVIAVFKDVPKEQGWTLVKDKLKAVLPTKVGLWFVSEISDKGDCFAATAPFDGDTKFFEELALEVGPVTLRAEVCHGEPLQQALKLLPKHIREKREKEARKRQKEKNRPILVGTQKFVNVGALRGRIKEILNSRSDGEMLKADGSDFKLIKAVLAFHPKGEQKSEGLTGIKVAPSTQGDNRCFFMVKADGTAEDFSAKKCLDAIELNPPYVPVAEASAPKEAALVVAKEAAPEAAKEAAKEAVPEAGKAADQEAAKEAAPEAGKAADQAEETKEPEAPKAEEAVAA